MALPGAWDRKGPYFIPLRLQLVTRMIEREMTREMQGAFQISVAEWRILASICTSGPASAADVAASYEADPGQISRAVADLIRAGLIKREKSPGGGKKRTISPTERGRETFDGIHQRRQAYFGKVMRDLSAKDVAALDSYLELIARRVDEERANAAEGWADANADPAAPAS